MPNKRLIVLLAISLVLGALAWLDNGLQPGTEASNNGLGRSPQGDVSSETETPLERTVSSDVSEEDTNADIDATQYMTAPEASSANPLAAIEITSLHDTVGRPLFASSRRRPPELAASTDGAAPPAPPTSFELLGVALGGSKAIAILRKKSDGTSYRVQAGDTLAGWQVSKVSSNAIVLERPEGVSEEIPLLRQ